MKDTSRITGPSTELRLYRLACGASLRLRKPKATHFVIQKLYSEGWREAGVPLPTCEEDLDQRYVAFYAIEEKWNMKPVFVQVAWTILDGPIKVPEQIILPLDVEQDNNHCAMLKALV